MPCQPQTLPCRCVRSLRFEALYEGPAGGFACISQTIIDGRQRDDFAERQLQIGGVIDREFILSGQGDGCFHRIGEVPLIDCDGQIFQQGKEPRKRIGLLVCRAAPP